MTEKFKLVTNAQESKTFKSNVTTIKIKCSNNFPRPYSVEVTHTSLEWRENLKTALSKRENHSTNKSALTAASPLACLEISSRNEEAINSTRNMIYSLKVFYFLLYRRPYFLNWFNTLVSDDRKYVCSRRLYACINTRKFKGLDSTEITSLPDIEKVIDMARHFNHRRK